MSDSEQTTKLIDAGMDVHPTPSAEEAAAIVAALRVLRREATGSGVDTISGWHLAARREGMRGELLHGRDHWKLNARLEP